MCEQQWCELLVLAHAVMSPGHARDTSPQARVPPARTTGGPMGRQLRKQRLRAGFWQGMREGEDEKGPLEFEPMESPCTAA
eukprot:scaffold2918_cov136-Isochrysis_galbana.AAC.1